MKKGLRTLNEEVNRMKSLFGNDRLYGNLIVEGSVDDISKKKEEILKILSDWENFNNDRSGVVLFDGDMISSSVIKKQITPIIDDTQEKVTGINPKDVCNEENKKLIDDKIKSIGDNKKNPNYSFLPKEDKDYLNSLETKLKEIRELCSVNVNVEPVEKIQSLDTVDVVGKRNGEETPEEETPEEETPEEETQKNQ